jgi:hypothetical protein
MKHEDKKHFDVSKPRRKSPDPTSKPIIVGHHPMMPDPMIREEREKAPKPIKVVSDGDESEPLTVRNSKDETLEVKPEAQPDPPVEEPVAAPEIPPESAPGAIFHPPDKSTEPDAAPAELPGDEVKPETPEASAADPIVPAAVAGAAVASATETATETVPGKEQPQPAAAEPPAGQELHIPAGHGHAAVRHKPRIWVWVTIGIIILIWVYAAVDALTNTKLPLEFFENSDQTAQPVTNAPTQTAPAQTTPPPAASTFVLPDDWKYYHNKELDFKFAYPSSWNVTEHLKPTEGTVIGDKNYQFLTIDSPDYKLTNSTTRFIEKGGQLYIDVLHVNSNTLTRDTKGDFVFINVEGEVVKIPFFTFNNLSVINGAQAVRGTCSEYETNENGQASILDCTYLIHNKKLLGFSYNYGPDKANKKYSKEYNQFLASIQFTD